MRLPLQITFRNMQPSVAIEARVRERARKLERFYDHIISCRVVIEEPHRQHHKGNLFHVRLDVTVPDGELVASRESGANHAHEDAYVAIRDAFDAMDRKLEDYARRRRPQDVKSHEPHYQGRVDQLFPDQDYGLIATLDGREVYFHRNSLQNADFEELSVGMPVRFQEQEDDPGPKASSVWVARP